MWLLLKLPPGQVVTCGDVIKLIGEFPSMARSLPVKLRALRSEGALDASRTCRVVNADGRVAALCDGQGPQAEKVRQNRELLDALEAEGGVRMDAKKPTSHVDLRARAGGGRRTRTSTSPTPRVIGRGISRRDGQPRGAIDSRAGSSRSP